MNKWSSQQTSNYDRDKFEKKRIIIWQWGSFALLDNIIICGRVVAGVRRNTVFEMKEC